ncbi:MAG: hypothetical protein ABFC57_12975 [Veillonellales bacterium]
MLELKPWEFEELQPHELLELWDGYIEREHHREDSEAYFTHWTANAFGGKVTPADILKPLRETPKQKKRTTVEALQEKFKGLL